MKTSLFLLMMIAHLVGDFYLQSEKSAKAKDTKFWWLMLHCTIYAIVAGLAFIPIWSMDMLWYAIAFGAAHFVIDLVKFFVPKKHKDSPKIYIADQLLHVLAIVIISIVCYSNGVHIQLLGAISRIFRVIQISPQDFFKVALLILLILKPVNITFKKIYTRDRKPKGKANEKTVETKDITLDVSDKEITPEQEKKEINLGAQIGSMERLLIVVLLLLNQYTAIGLVLTGKSVARYNKVSAEYYIVGTFFSLLCALIPFLVIWELM